MLVEEVALVAAAVRQRMLSLADTPQSSRAGASAADRDGKLDASDGDGVGRPSRGKLSSWKSVDSQGFPSGAAATTAEAVRRGGREVDFLRLAEEVKELERAVSLTVTRETELQNAVRHVREALAASQSDLDALRCQEEEL
jgi:hypothetical protein